MKKIRMAFLGAGNIASSMAETITKMDCVEPYAVAARDAARAKSFARRFGFCRSFGSYEEMLCDPLVDLVYVATPHSHHFAHATLCLEHGRHVLCEKAFTANAAQARELLALSERRGLLLTEAIWTRHMPMSRKISELLEAGAIGRPSALTANLGYDIKTVPRLTDPALAGGALLDVGVYPIHFASMAFGGDVEAVRSAVVKTETGVDAQNSITLIYRDGKMAQLYSSMLSNTDRRGIIYGSAGRMEIENINNPERVHVFSLDGTETAVHGRPPQITGYEYEVASAVEAIRAGLTECPDIPHAETLRIMELMDGLRAEWGVRFPFE